MRQYNEIENERNALSRKLFDAKELIKQVAELFPADIETMEQLDAADFKDKAGDTWNLVKSARKMLKPKKTSHYCGGCGMIYYNCLCSHEDL